MSNNLMLNIIKKIARTTGDILVYLLPKKANKLSENRITLIHRNKKNLTITERLMRYALVQKLEKIEDHNTIAEKNREFWINNTATELFTETEDTFKTDFLPHCSFIFEILKNELQKEKNEFDTLVEIGTGNGDVLKYLNDEFPKIEKFVGIDLSQNQIDLNRKKFEAEKKLEFVAADAVEWVKSNGKSNTIFVSSRGVLEYFLEKDLQDFLIEINQLGNAFFVAIEPNSSDHDFNTHKQTMLYGNEPSFSHNYPLLFKNAGFKIWHFSQQPWFNGGNMQTFLGAKS